MPETPRMHWQYPDEYQADWYNTPNGHVQLFNQIDDSMADTLEADSQKIPKDLLLVKGDLIAAAGPAVPGRVPLGATGQVLTVNPIQPFGVEWQTPAVGGTSIPATIVDAPGDLIAGTAPDTVARFPVGTDGQSLIADSTQTAGLRWGTVSGTGIPPTIVDVKGDLIAASGPDAVVRFPVGADGQVLTASSGSALTGLTWTTPAAIPTDLIPKTLLDARGDLVVASANDTPARLAVGADTHVLTADSVQPLGVKWAAAVMTPASDSITDTMLRNSAAVSVIGRSAGTPGDPADITAGADGNVLRRTGGVLGFGALDLSDSDAVTGILPGTFLPTPLPAANIPAPANNSITGAMLRDSVARSVIGNGTNATADPADIQAATSGHVLRLSGTTLAFGALDLSNTSAVTGTLPGTSIQAPLPAANIPTPANNSVTNAILRDSAALSVIGNGTNATADPADLAGTAGQVLRVDATPSLGFGAINLASSAAVTGVLPAANHDGIPKSVLVAKGDLVGTATGPTATRIGPIGANDTVLTADSTTTSGVKWATVPAGTPAAGSITSAMLRDSAANSVIGRSTNSAGVPADIATSTAGQVLRLSGTTLGFGAVDLDSANAVTGTLGVANGGTNLASGTDGGVLGFTGTTTLASSALLTNNALMLGGGAGATPKVVASLGTTTTVLHGNAAGAPTFGAVSLSADVTGTLGATNMGIVTTKGDLLAYSTTPARHAVGTNEYVLVSDSTQTTGLRWTPRRRFIGALIADSAVLLGSTGGNQNFNKVVTIPANLLTAGAVIQIDYRIIVATKATGPGTLTVFVNIGGGLVGYSDMALPDGHAGFEVGGSLFITMRSVGASGLMLPAFGGLGSFSAGVAYIRPSTSFTAAGTTLNTTVTRDIVPGVNFSVADAANTAKLQCLNVWVEFPEATVS